MIDKIKYPMNFEEFINKVTFLFLNNGFGDIEEKKEYLEENQTHEYLLRLYKDTCYLFRTRDKGAFNDERLNATVVSNLELDY